MNLKQLRNFLGVLRAGSITAAARSLHVAQPAIGAQIRSLEDELGAKLLTRHSRGVTPTEAGVLLARRAEGLIAEAERMRRDIMEMDREPRGRFALGLTGTAVQALGTRLIRTCHDKYPDLELTVIEAEGHRLTAWLGRGELDMAVTCAPSANAGAVLEVLAAEALYFVAPPEHPLAEGREIPLRAVLDADLVLPPKPAMIHRLLANAARAGGVGLRVVHMAESVTAIKGLVRDGFGCSVMPFGAVRRGVRDECLAAARIVDPHLARTLYLTCSQDRSGSRAVEAVCAEIRALVAVFLASNAVGWAPCATRPDPG